MKVVLGVKDDDRSPTMASFVITDDIERNIPDSLHNKGFSVWELGSAGLGYAIANLEFGIFTKELKGVYPLLSRRVASMDQAF